jgi:hypothetical protein
MDKHCKGCMHHYNAGWPKGHKNAKSNDRCTKHGTYASQAIGHCKNTNMKTIKVVSIAN